MKNYTIPVYQPDLSGNEKRYVLECLDSTWISSKGRFIGEFENQFANFVGARHAVGVCNGTIALHLALVTLGIGPGDEIIVPTLTYIAAANAIAYTGATPVFVDSLANTWQMDPEDVRRKITPRTKAVMAVHLYGHPCDMEQLTAICREQRIFLIEDCAEAFGAHYQGQHVGTFGDIAAFSFFGNKTITTGEGGMVVTNDKMLFERARHFKGQGLAAHREYWHDVIGYNYRMTNICAAIGLAQLERAGEFIAKKRKLAEMYRTELAGLPVELHGELGNVTHAHWMVSMLVETPTQRDPLREHLTSRGIETRPLFYPVHAMPMYATRYQRHPVAEDLAWRGINLPSWPGLTLEQVKFIASAIRVFFETKNSGAPMAKAPKLSTAKSAPPIGQPVRPEHAGELGNFFERLRVSGAEKHFHPHPLTMEEAAKRAAYSGKDFYGVLLDGKEIVGYGMLRGWDEGYEIPSLGIAIDPRAQGRGYGRSMMEYLHAVAKQRGAKRIRLKVYPENVKAVGLYRSLNYVFQGGEGEQLTGFFEVGAPNLPAQKESAR